MLAELAYVNITLVNYKESMRTIEYFMWGYQSHFYVHAKVAAEFLFNLLDPTLQPEVFLIGFLIEAQENRHPICIEQEDDDFQVDDFKDVPALAHHLEPTSPENQIIISNSFFHRRHLDGILQDAYREAIGKSINRKSYLRNRVNFVSKPTTVDDYAVFVVLELDKKAYEEVNALTKAVVDERYRVSRSLVESTVNQFLQSCTASLQLPNPGASLSDDFLATDREEMLRKAGTNFMHTLSWAANSIERGNLLFKRIDEISKLHYEGSDGLGKIVIAEKDHPNIKLTTVLTKPIELTESRKVRKLLQTTDQTTCIVSNGYEVFGLGELSGNYNAQEESLFVIHFLTYHHWLVSHNYQPLMRVVDGLPRLVTEGINRSKFTDTCKRLFGLPKQKINRLYEKALAATQQTHGALLVISSEAAAEADRLKQQSFSINPILLSEQNVHSFSSIDGAILADTDGVCYAIGVILDGPDTSKGDPSRGSRYNSAVRYSEYKKDDAPSLIIVVSEDGMVDLVPNLKPQIRRSTIDEYIQKLKNLAELEEPDRGNFNKLYNALLTYTFYLRPEDCSQINSLRKSIEAKFKKDGSPMIVRGDLQPNSEINDTYYTT